MDGSGRIGLGNAVLEATEADIPRILDMGERFHAAAGNPWPYSRSYTEAGLFRLLEAGCVFVSREGMIGGLLAPTWCRPDWLVAVELFWWAEDRNGLALLRRFEAWADEKLANEVRLTSLANLPAADRIIRRCGYEPREISYSKVI